MKSILVIIIMTAAFMGCKKSSIDVRILQPGTKCTIYAGVFNPGDKQPVQPVVVNSVYNPGDNSLIMYNVTDSNGVVWVLPDNDLKPIK
jgi:hypothetical protein